MGWDVVLFVLIGVVLLHGANSSAGLPTWVNLTYLNAHFFLRDQSHYSWLQISTETMGYGLLTPLVIPVVTLSPTHA